MNRALVLGASGHIGNAIVRELWAHGWQVTATSRNERRSANLESLDVDFRTGDPDDAAGYARWFVGHDLVVDAATPYPVHLFDFSGGTRTPMESAGDRTQKLIAACRSTGSTFACVSSFTTLTEPVRDPLTGLFEHPYFGVKRAIERAVLDAWERDLDVLIINPTLCLGPWDCKKLELTMLPYLVNPQQRLMPDQTVNIVDVREVGRLLRRAHDEGLLGRRLLCAGHNVALADLARVANRIQGNAQPRQTVPGAVRWGVLGSLLGEALYATAGQNSPYPALALMLLQRHEAFTPGAEQTRLGVEPRPLQETVADSLDWYRKLGYC